MTGILDWLRSHLGMNEDEDLETVDVNVILAEKYQEHKDAGGEDLNYKTSVKDLMKLLDLNSSFEARRELAKDLGYTGTVTADNTTMNVWLYNAIKRELKEHGGEWK